MIEELLAGNRRFVAGEFASHRDYYHALSQAQRPRILWIGCSDSRVSEHVITDSKPGTIFVHRNVANIVSFNDVNIAAIIEYAIDHLEIPDIVVCGHYKCGGIAALEEGISSHYIADWLLIGSGAKEAVDRIAAAQALPRDAKLRLLVEENVRLQSKHLHNLSLVKHRRPPAMIPRIHGWVYCMDTGGIKVLVDGFAGDSV